MEKVPVSTKGTLSSGGTDEHIQPSITLALIRTNRERRVPAIKFKTNSSRCRCIHRRRRRRFPVRRFQGAEMSNKNSDGLSSRNWREFWLIREIHSLKMMTKIEVKLAIAR